MLMGVNILLVIKYIVAISLMICIVLAPAYLAAANGKSKFDSMRVRCGSWLFGWSFIGWIFALFISTKK